MSDSPALSVVAGAIGALPRTQAMVLFLSVSGSSTRHIADVLGCSTAEVEKARMQITNAFKAPARAAVTKTQ